MCLLTRKRVSNPIRPQQTDQTIRPLIPSLTYRVLLLASRRIVKRGRPSWSGQHRAPALHAENSCPPAAHTIVVGPSTTSSFATPRQETFAPIARAEARQLRRAACDVPTGL